MKFTTTAILLATLALPGPASADHPYRGDYYRAQHEWARHYATTAIRQVHQNRHQHCNYYGQRWSTSYDDHYFWALRVSRHQAQSEIDRRDRDMRHCLSRHGGYYGYRWDGYRGYGNDHHRPWRYRGHDRHHGKRDHHDRAPDGWRDGRYRGHGRGHDQDDDNHGRRGDRRGG